MDPENKLALVVAYYLSKFDKDAYSSLGYSVYNQAHQEIGQRLGVKANTIKNMRDEFDAIHDNPRAGWYQREMRPSRKKVVEAFQDLTESELQEIVLEILNKPEFAESEEYQDLVSVLETAEKTTEKRPYDFRGVTGRRAEEIFIEHHGKTGEPQPGKLHDTRDLGCGYDFRIEHIVREYYVEVKGLNSERGGLSFTDKEWKTAQMTQDQYFLALVRNVYTTPAIHFIQNPTLVLSAQKIIFTTVQIRWTVSL
jgi:hypothetical protein